MDATIDISGPRKRTAVASSIAFHALLLLLMILLQIQPPDPPIPLGGGSGLELGLADLGYSDEGMGDEEVMDAGSAPQETSSAGASAEEPIAEDDGEVISTPIKDPNKKPNEQPNTKPVNKPPKINTPTISKELAEAQKAWNTTGGGGSTGPNTGGQGGSTVPGNEGGKGGAGGPGSGTFGSGPSAGNWKLEGRGMGKGPGVVEEPKEGGRVALFIWVDKSGKVTRATQDIDRSTTTSQSLVSIARKAAMQCTFTADPKAAGEQKGSMTFVFVLQ